MKVTLPEKSAISSLLDTDEVVAYRSGLKRALLPDVAAYVATKKMDVVDVEWFGAVDDGGVTDNTDAIQACLDASAGREVHFSGTGTYGVLSALTVSANTRLTASRGAIIRQYASNTALFTANGAGLSNITFDGLTLQGKGDDYVDTSGRVAYGIFIKGLTGDLASSISVTRCTITGFTSCGIWVQNATNVSITRNTIVGNAAMLTEGLNQNNMFGVALYGHVYGVVLDDNEISETTQGVFTAPLVQNFRCSKNYVHDIIGQHGFYFYELQDAVISSNIIKRCAQHGMKVQISDAAESGLDGDSILIIGNTVSATGGHSIILNNVTPVNGLVFKNVTVANNVVAGDDTVTIFGGSGIYLGYCDGVQAYGNQITKKQTGIISTSSTAVNLFHNRINHVGWMGLQIIDSTKLVAASNHIKDVGQSAANTWGILITENSSGLTTDITLDGNVVEDDTGAMTHSLRLFDTLVADSIYVRNNDFNGVVRAVGAVAFAEWHNNRGVTSYEGGYPSGAAAGIKAAHFHGTAAPTTGTWSMTNVMWNENPNSNLIPYWECSAGGTPGTWRAAMPLQDTTGVNIDAVNKTMGIGTTASATSGTALSILKSANSQTIISLRNLASTANTSAMAGLSVTSIDSSGICGAWHSSYTLSYLQDRFGLLANSDSSGLVLAAVHAGNTLTGHIGGTDKTFEFDANATAGNTRFLIYDVDSGLVQRVKVGANNSGPGGSGRALYLDNA